MLAVIFLFSLIESAIGNCTAGTELFKVYLEDSFGDGWNGENIIRRFFLQTTCLV